MRHLCCAALLVLGSFAHAGAQQLESKLVDSGDGTLELIVSGAGSPTVVFESGNVDPYQYWGAVENAISTRVRTVRYNRAGIGRSPLNSKPRTAAQIAKELHAALANVNVTGPYVLVGHSVGGLYAEQFARQFPAEIQGLVLVDPALGSIYEELLKDPGFTAQIERLRQFSPAGAAQMAALRGTLDGLKTAGPLPSAPLVVISATKPMQGGPDVNAMRAAQGALVQSIPGARQIDANGCSHNIPGECPAIVSDAILALLKNSKR